MTSATTPKTIELQGHGLQQEAAAGATITPGMLVLRAADGDVEPHGTAGGAASPSFANEYGLTGGTIDDDYEAGDQVIFTTYANGSHIYALVAAGAAAIAQGAFLQSAGDGTVLTAAAGDNVIGQALEAVDNSAGGTAVRIKIEVMSGYVSV